MKSRTKFAPRHAAMLGVSLALIALACGRDLLVGSTQMSDLHPGMPGTGGSLGAGGCLAGLGGSSGTGGTAAPACASVSTAPGQVNACGRTFGIAYSPDGQLLATATETPSPNVHIWRLSDGALLHDLAGHGAEGSYGVAFSPDGTLLATAGHPPKAGACGSPDPVADHPALVKLWDVATGALVREIPAADGMYADTAEFSHDGKRLVTGGGNGNVQIWNVSDGTRLATITTGYTTYTAHFSPDDSQIVNAGSSGGVWNASDGSAIFAIPGFSEDMNDAAFSPDQTEIVATGQGGALHFFDAHGAALQSLAAHTVNYISRVVWVDGDHVVSDDWGGNVKSWSRDASGQFASSGSWSLGTQALGMAVSPDRHTIAVALADGFVFLSYPPASPTP